MRCYGVRSWWSSADGPRAHSTTTPLCLFYATNQIASTCFIVALSVLSKRHHEDIIRSIDEAWMRAFDDGLGLVGDEGLEEFKRVMGGEWAVVGHARGTMS